MWGKVKVDDSEICYKCGFALSEQTEFRRDDQLQKLKEEVEEIRRCFEQSPV